MDAKKFSLLCNYNRILIKLRSTNVDFVGQAFCGIKTFFFFQKLILQQIETFA